jgi:hypothetical protein
MNVMRCTLRITCGQLTKVLARLQKRDASSYSIDLMKDPRGDDAIVEPYIPCLLITPLAQTDPGSCGRSPVHVLGGHFRASQSASLFDPSWP